MTVRMIGGRFDAILHVTAVDAWLHALRETA
jgi:hypothetical protein